MIVPLLRRIGSGKFSCSQLCNECESCQQLVLPNISDCSVVAKEDCEDNRSKFGCLKLCNEYESYQQLVLLNISVCLVVTKEGMY